MSQLTSLVTTALVYLTLISDIFIVLWLIVAIAKKYLPVGFNRWRHEFFSRHGILFAFIIALTAIAGSLFYSEAAGFEPCKLCWFQRVFMYPQVVLWAIALWRKDRRAADYAIGLSLIGGVIAAYHYFLALKPESGLNCSTIGHSVSCSQNFFLQLGYVTIPMMALTAFALIIIFAFATKNKK